MVAYYNEWESYPAQWLRNLIAAGLIAAGDVDERSIKDVAADDLKKYTQCHFFAGIGGWSLALRLALWPDERPVWTGSCPCQPFSAAGKQEGHGDERHLWPHWSRLIGQSKPATIFGEQVAGAIAFGWADEVSLDLEDKGYAFASAVLPACSIGAPHKRDRYWFVAHTDSRRLSEQGICEEQPGGTEIIGTSENVAHPKVSRRGQRGSITTGSPEEFGIPKKRGRPANSRPFLANTPSRSNKRGSTQCNVGGFQETVLRKGWHSHDWNTEPAVGRVANGIPARAHKLRAYGNAIVPQVAAAFIEAFMECQP